MIMNKILKNIWSKARKNTGSLREFEIILTTFNDV